MTQHYLVFTPFLDKAIADLVRLNRSLTGEKYFHQRLMLICMCDIMHQARICFEEYAQKSPFPIERSDEIELFFDGKNETIIDERLVIPLNHVSKLYLSMIQLDDDKRIPSPLYAHMFYVRHYQLYSSYAKEHCSLNDLVGYTMSYYPYHEIPDIADYNDIKFHPITY